MTQGREWNGSSRIDTLAIKGELAKILGEDGSFYWSKLKELFTKQTDRRQFQSDAGSVLRAQKATQIHNELVLALLHNVQANVPAPEAAPQVDFALGSLSNGQTSGAMKRRADVSSRRSQLKRKLLRSMATSVRLNSDVPLGQNPMDEPFASRSPFTSQGERIPFELTGIESVPSSCTEEGDLPTMETLRVRMKLIAAFQSLPDGLGDGCVEWLYQALHNYMKNIICDTIGKVTTTSGTTGKESAAGTGDYAQPDNITDMTPDEAEKSGPEESTKIMTDYLALQDIEFCFHIAPSLVSRTSWYNRLAEELSCVHKEPEPTEICLE